MPLMALTWGSADDGGDSSAVHHRMVHVEQIQATSFGAFAAILADGTVVTWGKNKVVPTAGLCKIN